MPDREEEHWAVEKSNLRYCSKHHLQYHEDVGCTLCLLDEVCDREEYGKTPRLPVCPDCGQNSLAWDKEHYECINLSCPNKTTCAKHEIVRVVPNTDQVLKCPRCGEESLIWVRQFVHYQCTKCKGTFDRNNFAHYECRNCMKTYTKKEIG